MDEISTLIQEAWDLRNKKGNLTGALEKVNEALAHDHYHHEALLKKSIILRDMGECAQAREILSSLLGALSDADSDLAVKADALRLLGFLALLRGEEDEAKEKAEQAYHTALSAKSTEQEANALALLGNVFHSRGERDKARAHYEKALKSAQAAHFADREITVSINMAQLCTEQGDMAKGLELFKGLAERTKDRWHKAYLNVTWEKARALLMSGKVDELLIQETIDALHIAQSHGWADEEGNLARLAAHEYLHQGDRDRAAEYLRQARDVFRTAGMPGECKEVEDEMARVSKQ